jgi:hypothetical protein
MGAFTAATTNTNAPNLLFVVVQIQLDGVGAIFGVINEQFLVPSLGSNLVGAITGGTGEFAGASGTFTQESLPGAGVGVNQGKPVLRGHFNLI